jgi:tyrosyl-tRNA synthetase
MMTADEVAEIERRHLTSPEQRPAQRALAYDLTARVHGTHEADRQVRVAEAAFAGGPITDPDVLDALFESVDHFEFATAQVASALDLAVASGLVPSKSEARRLISQGGLTLNGERVTEVEQSLGEPVAGRYFVLRAGRKRLVIARLSR